MEAKQVLGKIKSAIDGSARNGYVAELHLQVIKYAGVLQDVTGKEFCEALGVSPAYAPEFLKMRKIADRLVAAGLNVDKI